MAADENGVIYYMHRLLFLAALTAAGVALAENPPPASVMASTGFPLYLGMAVPVPDTIPSLSAASPPARHVPNGEYALTLVVDKKGQVKKLRYPSDSAYCYHPIITVFKQVHFRFLSGAKIDFPVIIPARLCYSNDGVTGQKVSLRFPISAELTSDGPLLIGLFAENKITPPAITFLPPVYYQLPCGQKPTDCRTITARVSLDAQGVLENLGFPFPGWEGMTHPLQAALIHASYAPARRKGKPIACDFFVTFRVFDNLRYPFTPPGPVDSVGAGLMTEKYFMTVYYNERDISIFPLPRLFADGVIDAGAFPRGTSGKLRAQITITPEGAVSLATVSGGQREQADVARKVLQLTQWYPARDNRGEAVWFTGLVTVVLDGTSRVVYIPEWIER
jgi:hypothetical protein